MPDATDLTDLAAAAAAPQQVSGDGQTVTEHGLADRIAAARFAREIRAADAPVSGWGQLKNAVAVPPGGV